MAATNCLNFGNPEKPEIMAQFSAAVDGIAEACTALGTPITGGNVSLYNETKGEGIYPTPVVGVVGLLEDVTKAVPSGFQRAGDAVALLTSGPARIGPESVNSSDGAQALLDGHSERILREFGSSEFAKVLCGSVWGQPPSLNLQTQAQLLKFLEALIEEGQITSASDISDGGLAVALARASFAYGIGARINVGAQPVMDAGLGLFLEHSHEVLVTCAPNNLEDLRKLAEPYGIWINRIGETIQKQLQVAVSGQTILDVSVPELNTIWSSALESQLAEEVTA
ncbi:MAG: AIR synthase-related protein [Acidobacteriaceae bacterium]